MFCYGILYRKRAVNVIVRRGEHDIVRGCFLPKGPTVPWVIIGPLEKAYTQQESERLLFSHLQTVSECQMAARLGK